ncbi:MAG: putative membrane protein YadS, partial [Glaciecola sp.]
TVFLLNGVALYLFPAVGHLVGLSQEQFGVWAAVAIHDMSSVVGAAAQFGDRALEVATVLKLTRSLWIVPLVAGVALWRRRSSGEHGGRVPVPWFIGLFVLASGLRSLLPEASPAFDLLAAGARRLLVLALFLVGTGLTRSALRSVGPRPLLQGVALWIIMAVGSLLVVIALPSLTM